MKAPTLARIRKYIALAFTSLVLVACGAEVEQENAAKPTPYAPVANMHDMMEHVLNPAAEVIWDSAGYIITIEGEENLAPTTDELWHEVINAAMVVTESGNLLMLPGRSAGDDWNEYSVGLIAAGKLAIEAAEAQDAEALFDAGGRIYVVCRACHNQYWVRVDEPE